MTITPTTAADRRWAQGTASEHPGRFIIRESRLLVPVVPVKPIRIRKFSKPPHWWNPMLTQVWDVALWGCSPRGSATRRSTQQRSNWWLSALSSTNDFLAYNFKVPPISTRHRDIEDTPHLKWFTRLFTKLLPYFCLRYCPKPSSCDVFLVYHNCC